MSGKGRARRAYTGLAKTSVQISPALLERINRIAAERGFSRSAVIAELLEKSVEQLDRRELAAI